MDQLGNGTGGGGGGSYQNGAQQRLSVAGSAPLGRWERWVVRAFPGGYMAELRVLFSLAWQTVFTSFCQFFLLTINVLMCGHLGKLELDAVSLASSLINVTGFSISTGLATVCDTLFSQTYGSANKKLVGIYLQRSLLVIWMFLFPVWAVQLNVGTALAMIGQDPEISRLTGVYMKVASPGALLHFTYLVLARYMQNQNLVRAPMIIAAIGDGVSVALHALFLYVLHLPYWWSAIAMNLALLLMVVLELLYLLISGAHRDTWDGWSREAVFEWGVVAKLAIPGMLLLAMEEWAFEIGTLLSGWLGKTELGAQAIIFQFEALSFMVPLGLSIAVNIRVGQQLGADNPTGALTTPRVAMTIILCTAAVMAIAYSSLKDLLPYLFTGDEEVARMAGSVIPLLALFQFSDGVGAVCNGAIRGSGRQALGATIVFVGFYVISIPLGCLFAFVLKFSVAGFWLGLIIGMTLEAVIFVVIIVFTDWKEQARRALIRAGLSHKEKKKPRVRQPADEELGLIGANGEATRYETLPTFEPPAGAAAGAAGDPELDAAWTRRNALSGETELAQVAAVVGGIPRPGSRHGISYARRTSVAFDRIETPGNLRSSPAFWTTLARRALMYVALLALLLIAIFFSVCARDPDDITGAVSFCFSADAPDVPSVNETSTATSSSGGPESTLSATFSSIFV